MKFLWRIFQGDALWSLLFVIAMMLVNNKLRKYTGVYHLHKSLENLNHVHGRHQIVCKKEKELKTQIQATRIYSQDIGINFGVEKCAMLIIKRGKHQMTEEIKLPNHTPPKNQQTAPRIRNSQIFGNIGSGHHQTCRDERKIEKNASGEWENYSKLNYIVEITWKG